ncbi:phage tail tip protein J-related protein [Aeromonas hydrophila]|uniref:phage tail tip protein J-related protein n=1 Tax=Aeromonas hydrophila TaxID=644 RepID=UPI002929379B|nr:DUF1983 domain-containing protein [Aeromonas hydrophila]
MPQAVIPVVVGLAAGAGSALFVSTVTAIAIGTAAMSATMMLTTKTPSLGDYTSASERSQLLRAAAAPKVACYGRVVSSVLMSFAEEETGEQKEGEWLHLAVVLAGHEIDRLGNILVGEDEVTTFGDLITYTFHNNPTEADAFLLEHCPSWKPDMIGRGLAWLRISYKSNFEKFPAGLPNLRIEKFGRRVYDPRDGQTKWTDNAALIILDYYRHWLKTPDDEINLEEFKVAANICDEIVTRPDGLTEARYTINGEFDLTEPKAKVLEAMHVACAGQPTYVGGRHGIVAGAYYGPATDELHDHQIIGDSELLPEPASADRINTVAGTFVDPNSFTVTDFPSVVVPEWVEEDGGIELAEDLDLRFVTSPYQAQRLANIMLRQRRTSRTVTAPVNLSGWRYRPGSYLRLYIPALGIAGAEFRVVDWGFNLLGGVNLTLREESVAVWDDAVGKPMERPDITTLPTGGLAMPDGLRYETEQIGDVVQGVLYWRNAGPVLYNQVIIQRLEEGKQPITVHTAQATGELCRLAGLPAGNYVALVRAVSITSAHSPVAAANFMIATPATPTGVEVEAGNWSLALRPQFAGGTDYGALCEWWWSRTHYPIDEAMAKATFVGTASYMTLQGLRPDTEYYVWLRTVNAYGKSGLVAAAAKTLYDPESILDALDGELGLDQLKEDLRRPIEKIPALDAALTDVSAIVADIKPVADRVPNIEHLLTEMDDELAAVAQRAEQAESVLKAEQDTLGSMGINTALQQDKLHGMLSSVRKEISDVRDAIFTVDPETGNIEMDAVRALRDEVHASVTHINQTLDAIEGTLSSKASQAVQDAQGERLTEAEQVLDGIKGQLTQLVTKSEFTAQGERLTEVSQKLDAATGELSQKAAQSDVTAQGERLGVAEQRISATADQASATAKAVDGLTAKVTEQGQELTAAITNVAEVSASATEQVARRVSGLETRTDSAEGKIRALEEVVESEGGVTAGRFDEISARLDLNKVAADDAALGAIGAALAGDAEAQRQRQTTAAIQRDQRVQVEAHQALAKTVETLSAEFEGEQADTAARFTSLREVVAGVERSTTQQLERQQSEFREADRVAKAALEEQGRTLSAADQALAEKSDKLQADLTLQGKELSAAVQTVAKAQADTAGKLSAGWYTQAQINGEGGGFGLSVTLAADGSVITSFAIDADVFAVLSRAGGVTSKRNPFVIKNGITYINHAMMDSAEIANVIAKYIRVTSLDAATIVNSDFKGGNAGFGRGGPYSGWGEGWHTIIYADGTIRTNKLYADSGSFTGHVRANSGEFNNVVIRENCQILGQLDVTQVVGDIVKMIRAPANVYVAAYRRDRVMIAVKPINASAVVGGVGELGIRLVCKLNGQVVDSALKTQYVPTGGNPYFNISLQPAIELPAYGEVNITFEVERIGGSGISNIEFSGMATWLIAVK